MKPPTGFSLQGERTNGPRAANGVLQNDTGIVNESGQAPSDRVAMDAIESALVLQ
jgi:hypothetical protein